MKVTYRLGTTDQNINVYKDYKSHLHCTFCQEQGYELNLEPSEVDKDFTYHGLYVGELCVAVLSMAKKGKAKYLDLLGDSLDFINLANLSGIYGFSILPEYRGKRINGEKISKILLSLSMQRTLENGANYIAANTENLNAAKRFKNLGFYLINKEIMNGESLFTFLYANQYLVFSIRERELLMGASLNEYLLGHLHTNEELRVETA